MNDEEKIRTEALRLLKETFKVIGSKGRSRNTDKQRKASAENLKRARWKKYHPFEPYPGD